MNAIILNPTQSEDIDHIQSLFDDDNIIALDTMPSMFTRINNQVDIPKNYTQGFTMSPYGYLYYYRPVDTDVQKVNDLLIELQSKMQ
jgi:chromosome condensin MukBEF ATPase and DNA-binding subunit MukB